MAPNPGKRTLSGRTGIVGRPPQTSSGRSTVLQAAYNEFCAPTLSEAIEQQIADGAKDIAVVSTMFTPGGSHSEYEIPEEMDELRQKYPDVTLTYAWPFDLDKVAEMLCEHLDRFQDNPVG